MPLGDFGTGSSSLSYLHRFPFDFDLLKEVAAERTLVAELLVGGSALFVSGATVDWLQQVGDHFAARSLARIIHQPSSGRRSGPARWNVNLAATLR